MGRVLIASLWLLSGGAGAASAGGLFGGDGSSPRDRRGAGGHGGGSSSRRGWWLGLGRGGSLQAASSARVSASPPSSSSSSQPRASASSSGASSGSPPPPSSFSSSSSPPQPSHMFRRGHGQPPEQESRMPSLFVPEESVYDRYAACLAATEGLRRIRDRDLAEEVALRAGFATSPAGAPPAAPPFASSRDTERQINLRYLQNSERVLKSLGMSVGQFNDLGRQVTQDEKLREKVMEQAYLYRMAATIHMDRMPLLEDARSRTLLQNYRRDKVDVFCDSMTEIEQLRGDQIERLKKSLRVDKFPENLSLSDPRLLPFLSPKVRAVIEAFPYQAEEIIKRNGLESDEFNKMLEETRSNPLFRWKVQKNLRRDHHLHPDQHPDGAGGSDPLVGSGPPGQASSSFRANR